jgi:hypothetical protein
MAYLGTPPQSGFITTAKQRVTSSTNAYVDLDHAISSIADVIVFVNFVKQDTTNLTLTTSTRITLGGTLVSSDIVEIHYLGKAVNTQTPSAGTVTNDMLAGSIALDKLSASGTKSSSTFLRGDNTFAEAGGGDLSFGGDTFGADKTIGSNDNYALSIETNNTERLKFTNDGRGLAQFTAKAWAVSNGTGTVAIIDSHNISSLADPESGQLVHNFANSMANANYAIIVNSWYGYSWTFGGMDMSTTSFKAVQSNGSSYQDSNRVSSLVFGD